jgi:anti-sigma regulatory factor (Ser/Thr protein kinase)
MPPVAASVAAARHQARDILEQWSDGSRDDEILLMLNELAANAVQHARSPFSVHLTLTTERRRPTASRTDHPDRRDRTDRQDRRFVCGVDDLDPRPPQLQPPCPDTVDALGGRGMHLIDQLADTWGVTQHPHDGKTVWFEILIPAL